MTDSELVKALIQYTLEQLRGGDLSDRRMVAIQAFEDGDDRTIKISALLSPKDRFLDSLSYLSGARRLSDSNPITALTTVKEAIGAMSDVRKDKTNIWDEVTEIVITNVETGQP